MSLPSWSFSVKSGAAWPISTGTGAFLSMDLRTGSVYAPARAPHRVIRRWSRRRWREVARAYDFTGVVGVEHPCTALRQHERMRDLDTRRLVVAEQNRHDVAVRAHQRARRRVLAHERQDVFEPW